MPIPLVFQGKFTEKYFKKFHLPQTQFELLDGRFLPLLPYFINTEKAHCSHKIGWNSATFRPPKLPERHSERPASNDRNPAARAFHGYRESCKNFRTRTQVPIWERLKHERGHPISRLSGNQAGATFPNSRLNWSFLILQSLIFSQTL